MDETDPTLSDDDPIDVAAMATGTPVARSLCEQITSMLDRFLAGAASDAEATIEVQVGWSSSIETGPTSADGPVVLVPPTTITVDGAFAGELADAIASWVADEQPPGAGWLTFDLTSFTSTGDGLEPVARLGGLRLDRADVTDL